MMHDEGNTPKPGIDLTVTLADILHAIERLTLSVDALHDSFKAVYGGTEPPVYNITVNNSGPDGPAGVDLNPTMGVGGGQ